MEVVAETKLLTVHMKCDQCGEGFMVMDGDIFLTTYPTQYPHKCNKCGHRKTFDKMYPSYRYVQIENFREPTIIEKVALE